MFFRNLWTKILSLFGVKTSTTSTEYNDNQKYINEYQNVDKINFNAIFSSKLSNYCANESSIMITGDNKRAKYLDEKTQEIWDDRKKIFNRMFGVGGVFIVPFYENNEIQYNIVPQSNVSINKKIGKKITDVTIASDFYVETNGFTSKKYYRWTDYKIENNIEIIRQRYTDENGSPVERPEIWADIDDEITITNVEKVTIGYFKSPVDNRQNSDNYGVPITYGCDATIKEIRECLKQIMYEFKAKEVFIGVDFTLFGKQNGNKIELPDNHLYRKFNGDDSLWEVFDPSIRDSSYYSRLQELYSRLEKEIGTSRGILTEIETATATATAIRKALYDTFTIVNDTRTSFEKGMTDLIDAINVLCNYYSVTPIGEYEIAFDWGYELLQDSQEEFAQMIQGINQGVISKLELRQWLKPNESSEESEKVIAEIQEQNPSVEELIGR